MTESIHNKKSMLYHKTNKMTPSLTPYPLHYQTMTLQYICRSLNYSCYGSKLIAEQ